MPRDCPNCHVALKGANTCPCGWEAPAVAVRCIHCHRPPDINIPGERADTGYCWQHYHARNTEKGTEDWRDRDREAITKARYLNRRGKEPRSEWLARLGNAIPDGQYGDPFKRLLRREYLKAVELHGAAEGEA